MNALVFGLSGALAGGLIAALTEPKELKGEEIGALEGRDKPASSSSFYRVENPIETGNLPDFLKHRLQPVVIEEAHEVDTLSEDGTLHEPHKVYRIKRAAELISKPLVSPPAEENK
ncbi:MAG: hypothetical protein AB7F66_13480 [Bacteriovoracia bacterium]